MSRQYFEVAAGTAKTSPIAGADSDCVNALNGCRYVIKYASDTADDWPTYTDGKRYLGIEWPVGQPVRVNAGEQITVYAPRKTIIEMHEVGV